MPKSFYFEGKRYDRLEDMPPDAQEAYRKVYALLQDGDQDGIPDILQGEDAGAVGMIDSETVVAMQNMPGWMKRLLGKFGSYVLRDMPPLDSGFRGGGVSRVTLKQVDAPGGFERLSRPPLVSSPMDDFSRARTTLQLVLLALTLITLCAMAVLFVFPWLNANFF